MASRTVAEKCLQLKIVHDFYQHIANSTFIKIVFMCLIFQCAGNWQGGAVNLSWVGGNDAVEEKKSKWKWIARDFLVKSSLLQTFLDIL